MQKTPDLDYAAVETDAEENSKAARHRKVGLAVLIGGAICLLIVSASLAMWFDASSTVDGWLGTFWIVLIPMIFFVTTAYVLGSSLGNSGRTDE